MKLDDIDTSITKVLVGYHEIRKFSITGVEQPQKAANVGVEWMLPVPKMKTVR